MSQAIELVLATILRCFHAPRSLPLENLVFRQQLALFKRKQPKPRLSAFDKLIWVFSRRFLVRLETAPHHCEPGRCCPVAPGLIRALLWSFIPMAQRESQIQIILSYLYHLSANAAPQLAVAVIRMDWLTSS